MSLSRLSFSLSQASDKLESLLGVSSTRMGLVRHRSFLHIQAVSVVPFNQFAILLGVRRGKSRAIPCSQFTLGLFCVSCSLLRVSALPVMFEPLYEQGGLGEDLALNPIRGC